MYKNRPSRPHFWRVYKYKLLWYFSSTEVNSKETVKGFCTVPKFAPFPKLQRVKTVPKLQRFKAFPKLQRFKTVWNYKRHPFEVFFYLSWRVDNNRSEPITQESFWWFFSFYLLGYNEPVINKPKYLG